jgi:hypothetical protein
VFYLAVTIAGTNRSDESDLSVTIAGTNRSDESDLSVTIAGTNRSDESDLSDGLELTLLLYDHRYVPVRSGTSLPNTTHLSFYC